MYFKNALLSVTGWFVLLASMIVGVPLFVRMPPWCDLTLYDVAARTVINGGTLYADVFDTNLPGFVWCLIGIRRAFGTSVEAVRIVDFVVVAAITILLIRFVRKCGSDGASVSWLAASVALFYPFTSEFSHCQRDVWMTLPMLLAVTMRVRTIVDARPRIVRVAMLEGALWGVAVWFKPHVALVAIAIWFITRPSLRKQFPSIPRVARIDFLGNLSGGIIVGLIGILALVWTGTWKPFAIVFTKWNANYMLTVWGETGTMFGRFLNFFPPWSLLHLIAIPFAIRSTSRLIRCRGFEEMTFRRGILCEFYLAILLQACFLQRNFDYVHIPEMLLAFAVVTIHLPRMMFISCLLFLGSTLLCLTAERYRWPMLESWCVKHRLADLERTRIWSDCFRTDLSLVEYRKRQQALSLSPEYFSAINVVEIGEVCDFLRTQKVTDGDVIAWHDTPHALYLDLDLKPSFRFMHITTTLVSEANFERMTIELKKKSMPAARFVVSDLMHPMRFCGPELWSRFHEAGPDLLPPFFTWRLRNSFPYDQPAVFRSNGGRGRYIVHHIEKRNLEMFEFQWDIWE